MLYCMHYINILHTYIHRSDAYLQRLRFLVRFGDGFDFKCSLFVLLAQATRLFLARLLAQRCQLRFQLLDLRLVLHIGQVKKSTRMYDGDKFCLSYNVCSM